MFTPLASLARVPLSVVYDNDSCLVAKIEADGRRRRTQMFTEMLSHYLFDDRYGRPGKGMTKATWKVWLAGLGAT